MYLDLVGSLILLAVLGAHIASGDAELGMESNERVGSLSIFTRAASMSLLNTSDCSVSLVMLSSGSSSLRISSSSASSLVSYSCKLILINRVVLGSS